MNGGLRLIAAIVALAGATSAQAQSVKDDFQLPPGAPTPAAPAVGPTDSEAPAPTPRSSPQPAPTVAIPRPPRPVPSAAPSPRPTPRPSPRATTPAPVRSAPAPVPTPAPRPAPSPPAQPSPAASPAPAILPSATPSTPAATQAAAVPQPEATASVAPSDKAPPAASPAGQGDDMPDYLLWLVGGLGALLAVFAAFLIARRARRPRQDDDWSEDTAPPAPAPAPAPAGSARAAATPAQPQPTPLPAPTFAARPFDLTLEPARMTLALINASLTYRLAIVNRDDRPLGPLRITCDLISAHASLQAAEQLVPDPAQAWLSHDFDALPPGESLVVDGEVRLPRTEILPVRNGPNTLFVPLARFTVQTLDQGVPQTVGARVFVIGEEPDQPGMALKPFRLNDGTRSYSRIGQREVTIAR